jgi:WD40 repeat protein/serine/threonine protein kinase
MPDSTTEQDVVAGVTQAPVQAPSILDRLGDYRILREIGRGGMGFVYEALQESLSRRVALKVLPGTALLDPQMAIRFHREAQAAARLHHTNIVQVYGVGEHNGLHYYVMQFIQGRSLDRVLAELRGLREKPNGSSGPDSQERARRDAAHDLLQGRSDPSEVVVPPPADATQLYQPAGQASAPAPPKPEMPAPPPPVANQFGTYYWRGVARIGIQVAQALAYAHGQGLLHRDIKPSNLLLDDQGTVWITDFGLAKEACDGDGLTRPGEVVGTVRYLGPERFRGLSDARSDIYSLGLTLYELLTLTPAFTSPDRSQLLQKVMHEEPRRPRLVNSGVPRDLETVVLKAIARDPERRYSTAREFAEDLQRFLDDRPIRARRAGSLERSWRWCRRNPKMASLSLAVLLLCLTVAIGSTVAAVRIAAARDDQERERLRAEANARKSHDGLVQLQITKGLELVDGGDLFGALGWFARGLVLDAGEPGEEMHRIRLNAILCQCPRLVQMVFHEGPTYSVEFSPDGRRFITSGDDGVSQVWDRASGAPVLPPLRHRAAVTYATFSPDGRRLLTTSQDGTARLWDAATGTAIGQAMTHADAVWTGSFSTDGRFVATASEDKTARVWDAATGKPITPPLTHDKPVAQATFSDDGRWVVTCSEDKTAKIWDVATGRLHLPPLQHDDGIDWAVLSPNAQALLTVAGNNAYLWDTRAGTLTSKHKLHGEARRCAFSPDGKRYVVAGGDIAQVWDTSTGLRVGAPMRHATHIWFVTFSPDGRRVATVGGDASRLWDAVTGEPLTPLLRHHGLANHAAFTPDGRFVATTGGNTANVWDTAIMQPAITPLQQALDVKTPVFSADGRLVAGRSPAVGRIGVWDTATGRSLPTPEKYQGSYLYAGFGAGGSWLVTTQDKTASVWELATRQELHSLPAAEARLRCIAISPDNRFAVTAGEDKTARVWDLHTAQQVGKDLRHADIVTSAAFSPEGSRVLTVCTDWTVRVRDWETGRSIGKVLKHGGPILHATFSPDGQSVLTSSHDRTSRVWDAETGEPRTPPLVHAGQVYAAAFSPDARYVATASADATARVWEAATGLPLTLPLRHGQDVIGVVFSPDGRLVMTVTKDGKVWRWDLGLTPDTRPTGDLVRLAQLLDGHELDAAGGFVPVDANSLKSLWRQFHSH